MRGLTQVFPDAAMRILLHIPRLLISSSFHSGFPETPVVLPGHAYCTVFTTLLILFLAGESAIEGCISPVSVLRVELLGSDRRAESRLEHWDLSDRDPMEEFPLAERRSPDRSNPQSREGNLNLRDFVRA